MNPPEHPGPGARIQPYAQPLPASDEVHLVMAECAGSRELEERFLPLLDSHEQGRAARFGLCSVRNAFVARRGLLRFLLGRYLGEEAGALRFEEGPFGKPGLAPPHNRAKLYFSVSHSDRVLAYAFARQPCIGIDVERVRADLDFEGMAPRTFSSATSAVWQALPELERRSAFFLNWTRKEAVVKAAGVGLRLPLNDLDVSFVPGEPAGLLRIEDFGPADAWHLLDIDALPGYACAAAVCIDGGSGVRWGKVRFIGSNQEVAHPE